MRQRVISLKDAIESARTGAYTQDHTKRRPFEPTTDFRHLLTPETRASLIAWEAKKR